MALHHFPRIVTDGLVLCLDAGNPLSYPSLGPELVTNSDLLVADDGNYDTIENTNSPCSYTGAVSTAGRTYQISWKVLARRGTTSATLRMIFTGIPNSINFNTTPGILNTSTLTIPNSSSLNICVVNTGVDFDLDYVSIREMSTTINDISGNGNNGTLTNGPVFNLDNKGSISFDGVDDIVPSINTVSRLSNSCTEVWFKADGMQPIGQNGISRSMIFGYSHVGGTFSNFVTGPIVLAQSNKIYTSVTDTQGFPSLTSNATINNNVYYHVCLNKDTINGLLSLYINGIFDKSTTFNPDGYPVWAGAPRGSNSVEIGGYTNGTGSSYIGTGRLKGSVAVAKMYNRTLSASEVSQNYNALKGRFGL